MGENGPRGGLGDEVLVIRGCWVGYNAPPFDRSKCGINFGDGGQTRMWRPRRRPSAAVPAAKRSREEEPGSTMARAMMNPLANNLTTKKKSPAKKTIENRK